MHIFFRVLSLFYVAAVFLLADSSAAKGLATVNRFSLLHIPLYGIMSLLLFLSITPVKFTQIAGRRLSIRTPRINLKLHCFIAGVIALGVAVADEYCQSFISTRAASAGDVLLDLVGIILSLVLVRRFYKSNALFTPDATDIQG
jgi:hypothetical protein